MGPSHPSTCPVIGEVVATPSLQGALSKIVSRTLACACFSRPTCSVCSSKRCNGKACFPGVQRSCKLEVQGHLIEEQKQAVGFRLFVPPPPFHEGLYNAQMSFAVGACWIFMPAEWVWRLGRPVPTAQMQKLRLTGLCPGEGAAALGTGDVWAAGCTCDVRTLPPFPLEGQGHHLLLGACVSVTVIEF